MTCGFLPMAQSDTLLPKLHLERCLLEFKDLHVSKNTKKRSKKYYLSMNQNLDAIIDATKKQHGYHCWLYPKLVDSFKKLYKTRIHCTGLYRSSVSTTLMMT